MYKRQDIDAIIDITIEGILEKAIMTGLQDDINTENLLAAAKTHKATSTLSWFEIAKNYAEFANKSGLYDEVKKNLNM